MAIQNIQLKSMLTVKEKAIQSQKEVISKQKEQLSLFKKVCLYNVIVSLVLVSGLLYLSRKKKTT